MKKSYLPLAATACLLLASCSQDELVQAPGQPAIGFDSFVGKTTRATDATNTNLLRMSVYGYIGDATPAKIFNGTMVSRTTQAAEWTYKPLQYWTAGKKYFFTALSSPSNEGNNHFSYTWADNLPTATEGFYGTGTITFDNSQSKGNEDVVYAFATKVTDDPLTTSPGKVEFLFKHALSRVIFTFNNKMGSDAYTIKVYGLTINNATSTADLVLGTQNPTWSNHANTTVLTLRDELYNPQAQTAANNASVASGTKFIIPGELTFNITFKVDLILNGTTLLATYNHVAQALPKTVFQNGHSYNFVADLTPDNIDPENDMFPIEFNVTDVEEWIPEADIPVVTPETPEP